MSFMWSQFMYCFSAAQFWTWALAGRAVSVFGTSRRTGLGVLKFVGGLGFRV